MNKIIALCLFIALTSCVRSFQPNFYASIDPEKPFGQSLNQLNPNYSYPEVVLVNKTALNIPYPGQFYTGYITVNQTSGSKVFYQLYAARGNLNANATVNDSAPLIMPLAGGPGSPGINSYYESGPFRVLNINGQFVPTLNNITFNDNYHLLYLDNPIGVGWSVYNNDFPSTSIVNAYYLQNFLNRFFQLFPNLKKQQFYIMGESYGAHWTLGLATILVQNKTNNGINVTGIIFQDGWFDPYNQITGFDKLALAAGLGDLKTISAIQNITKRFQQDTITRNYSDAISLVDPLFNLLPPDERWNNYRNESLPDLTTLMWIQSPPVKTAMGVDPTASYVDTNLRGELVNDFPQSYAVNMSYMLNTQNIKFLLYWGQDDSTVPTAGTELAIHSLTWTKLPFWVTSPQTIWKDTDGNVIGWYKHYDKLTFAMIYKAGHISGVDQPWSVKNILDKYIQNNF